MNKSADKKVDEKVQLSQITRNLQIVDGFVWINKEPEMTLPTIPSESDRQVATSVVQCETNHVNSCMDEENGEDDVGSISNCDRESSMEDLYWEESGMVIDKIKSQLKVQTSNRKTVRECYFIANNSKRISRQPSYFGFDDRTCHILESIPLKMGPLAYVAGKGSHSLVIHADILPSNRTYFSHGCAVKVYKLGSDVKKNLAMFKRAKREEENLRSISTWTVPSVFYRSRNVIITTFLGFDRETASSIDSISSVDYLVMYQRVVEEMVKWYNKAEVVHGNLSSKNLVSFYDRICYIGWSHSVRRQHPLALTKLMKDCHFVTEFFGGKCVPVKPIEELFKEITGLDNIKINKVLDALSKKDLWKDLHPNNPNRISEDSTGPSRNERFKKLQHSLCYYI